MKTLTAWISKYALTIGIFSVKAEDCRDGVIRDLTTSVPCYYHKSDWHMTREEAIKQGEKMRVKKIASIKKQLKKLDEMKFQ